MNKLFTSEKENRRNGFLVHFVLLMLLLGSIALQAGAWVQKKSGYFLKIGSGFHRTGQEFNYLGEKINIFEDLEVYENTAYQEFKLKVYGEYGFTSRLTLVADVPLKIATSEQTQISNYFDGGRRDTSFTTVGLGDFAFYARLGILDGPLVLSLQPGIKIPLGYSTDKDNEGPALGTGDVDVEGALLVGTSLYPAPIYITGSVGYRHRSGRLHDEYFATIETGLTLAKFRFNSEFSILRNEMDPPDIFGGTIVLPLPGGGGAVPDRLFGDQDFSKLNLEAVYKLKDDMGLSGEIIHMLAGKNIITGTTFQLGLTLAR